MNTIQRIEFTVPIRTVSEMNSRDHWRVKNARKKAQQEEVAIAMHNAMVRSRIELPCSVRMIRYGQKALDSDNLASSFKGCQDVIAQKLGVDDGDTAKVKWLYEQQPTGTRNYFVRVEICSIGR